MQIKTFEPSSAMGTSHLRIQPNVDALCAVDFGRLVASGSQDGTVRLWEAPSGRLLATLHGHTGAVMGVALSGDGRRLTSGSFDGSVRL